MSRIYEDVDEQFKNETFHNQEFSVPHAMKPLYTNYQRDPFQDPVLEQDSHDSYLFTRSEKHRMQPFVHICKNGVRVERTAGSSRVQYARHDTTTGCYTPVLHGGAVKHNTREVSFNSQFRTQDSRLNSNIDHDMH